MSILVDTNVLLRGAEPTHPQHALAVDVTSRLITQGDNLSIVPQVLYEFWAVATRPLDQNGLGFDRETARNEMNKFETMFVVLSETAEIFSTWHELVFRYDVMGKPSHDARLVAAMIVHRMDRVLTFNVSDFRRFTEIEVLDAAVAL